MNRLVSRPAWFVTGTDTEIGKTLVTCAMLHALGKLGAQAAGMKPIAAGAVLRNGAWHNEDADQVMEASSLELPPELVVPCLLEAPMAPHLAAALEGRAIDPQALLDAYDRIARQAQAVVVEGVGGFRVPLTARYDTADLAQSLGLPIVMVVGMRLGCISHALLTAEAIAARGLTLAGWVANTVDPAMRGFDANVESLRERLPAPLLGVVPRLPAASAAAAAAHLDFTRLPAWPRANP